MAEDDTEHFSLRWNNFHSNLASGFHALLQGEDLVDVTLAAEGKFLQAHKIVLSVCSPYFKELFKVNPCKHPIVILKDVAYKDLVAILQFMYKGEANVRQEELSAFLKTGETLQIKGLTGEETSEEEDDRKPKSNVEPLPTVSASDRSYKRHSVPTHSQPLASASPPPPRKRIRADPPVSLLPIPVTSLPPSQGTSGEFVGLAIPKLEPVDYGSDIEVLDVKHDQLSQLLRGETSQSRHDDTDSHQSHFDISDTNLDSNQSHLENSQSQLDENQTHQLNSSQGSSSGMFSSIGGLSHSQEGASQDGSQDTTHVSCTICGKKMWRGSLRRHINDCHSSNAPLPCHICFKLFKTNNSLSTHLHVYHKEHKAK